MYGATHSTHHSLAILAHIRSFTSFTPSFLISQQAASVRQSASSRDTSLLYHLAHSQHPAHQSGSFMEEADLGISQILVDCMRNALSRNYCQIHCNQYVCKSYSPCYLNNNEKHYWMIKLFIKTNLSDSNAV